MLHPNIMKHVLDNPLIVALDVDSDTEALRLATQIGEAAGAFKIGPRLVVKYGQTLIKALAERAPVFLDHKFLDIPSTMEAAVRSAFDAGATLATVHAWAGPEALKKLAVLEKELNQKRPFKILTVTILTSFEQNTLPATNRSLPIFEQVEVLAYEAAACGLHGLVCSPLEVGHLRRRLPQSFLVTPGIRWNPADNAQAAKKDDQKRTLTPAEAIAEGASALVIGRPIIGASNPRSAAEQVLNDLKGLAR